MVNYNLEYVSPEYTLAQSTSLSDRLCLGFRLPASPDMLRVIKGQVEQESKSGVPPSACRGH